MFIQDSLTRTEHFDFNSLTSTFIDSLTGSSSWESNSFPEPSSPKMALCSTVNACPDTRA